MCHPALDILSTPRGKDSGGISSSTGKLKGHEACGPLLGTATRSSPRRRYSSCHSSQSQSGRNVLNFCGASLALQLKRPSCCFKFWQQLFDHLVARHSRGGN